MKVLLINPPIREWARPNCFPTGLGYIASVLRMDGHEVEIMDINALRLPWEEVERKLRDAEYDLAGMGGIVTIYRYIKWLAHTLKKLHPHKPVVVGGSAATSIPNTILAATRADIAVLGEGERIIVDVVRALQKGLDLGAVPGILFRKNGKIESTAPRPIIPDLDTIPFPSYDLFPMDVYLGNTVGGPNRDKWEAGTQCAAYTSMNISGSRGCPYQCIYCYHDFLGARWRHRGVENILDEIQFLIDTYKVSYIDLNDDCFVINRRFLFDFCRRVHERGMKFDWGICGRVNLVDRELLETVKAAGCASVVYGIESGSQKILDLMKKRVTVDQAKKALALTREIIGENLCTLIIGSLGETRDTVEETIRFCQETGLRPEAVFFATPYPGTELYRIARRRGLIKDEEEFVLNLWEQGEKISVNFTEFTDAELYELKQYMVREVGAGNVVSHQPPPMPEID